MRADHGYRRRAVAAMLAAAALLAGCTAPSAGAPSTSSGTHTGASGSSAATASYLTGDPVNSPDHTVTVPTLQTDPTTAPGSSPATMSTPPGMTPATTLPRTTAMSPAPPTSRARTTGTSVIASPAAELPGGGRTMFPGRTLVALYGHPGTPSLGALGQQDLDESIERAERVAATYRGRVAGPVIPTFEIIATVARGGPGADGTYSVRTSVSTLRPWVDAATAAGMYVILDLQPGRANLLAQANYYVDLLRRPHVGLAIDPEWKLGPGQRPLQGFGGVDADEVNGVIAWLSRLTAADDLPQKVLVLHQFHLPMLRDEQEIVTDDDNVAVLIHMDGQGSPAGKNSTWAAVVGAAPPGVFFGWKNFFAKDRPMMDQATTLARTPVPVMISYQ